MRRFAKLPGDLEDECFQQTCLKESSLTLFFDIHLSLHLLLTDDSVTDI
jgi:hypothetical protein